MQSESLHGHKFLVMQRDFNRTVAPFDGRVLLLDVQVCRIQAEGAQFREGRQLWARRD